MSNSAATLATARLSIVHRQKACHDFCSNSFWTCSKARYSRFVNSTRSESSRSSKTCGFFGRPGFFFGFGFAISLDGGLEEVEESLRALASCSSSSAIRAACFSNWAACYSKFSVFQISSRRFLRRSKPPDRERLPIHRTSNLLR